MTDEPETFDLRHFNAWLAAKMRPQAATAAVYEALLTGARIARDEFLTTVPTASMPAVDRIVEVVKLWAAGDADATARPPDLMTARGFRITLSYEVGSRSSGGSICALVRSPPELVGAVQGHTAYLWNGSNRYELGQFDFEGKAIGTLPAGIEISVADLTTGNVRFDGPPLRSAD